MISNTKRRAPEEKKLQKEMCVQMVFKNINVKRQHFPKTNFKLTYKE